MSVLAWAEKARGRGMYVSVFIGGSRYARHVGPYQTLLYYNFLLVIAQVAQRRIVTAC